MLSDRRQFLFVPLAALALLICSSERSTADGTPGEAVLVLRGPTNKTVRLTQSEFKKLPRTEVEVVDNKGAKARYSGVAVRELLDKIDVPKGEGLRGEWMRAFLSVAASDDYFAVFALPELDSAFTDRKVILADTCDGQPLPKRKGPFQIIVPGEKRHARWVFKVKELHVVDGLSVQKDSAPK
jgi:hypothetical protein